MTECLRLLDVRSLEGVKEIKLLEVDESKKIRVLNREPEIKITQLRKKEDL